jgi:uncharacterized metal-binding protein YceD (DUF177 family)
MTPEFSRPIRIDTLGSAPKTLSIEADTKERAALAGRFELVAIDRLSAELQLTRSGESVTATGTLLAQVTQSCVASGANVPARLEEPFTILFRPQPHAAADEEIELGKGEMDVVFYDGAMIDVGEAAAETLSLSLDPYPRSPEAEAALRQAGVKSETEAEAEEAAAKAARSPFAALRKK